MKKKVTLLTMTILLFLMMFIIAGKAFTAVEKPIELKFAHFMSPMHHQHKGVFTPLAKEIEERTGGKVKVTIYPAEALGKAKDMYDMAMQGVSDMSFFIPGYTAGRFPLTSVMELPLNISSAKVGTQVIWELYEKYLKSEYRGVKMLSVWVNNPNYIFTTQKPIKTLEDLRGLRIRSPGPQETHTLKELGASPILLPMSDVYEALQRGMVDGLVAGFSGVKDFKLMELVKYSTIQSLYVLPMGLAMNQKVWDSFSPDIKKIMEELCGFPNSENNAKSFDKDDLAGREASKGKVEIYELSAEQNKIWAEKFKLINEKWVADMEAKGLPGKKVFEDANLILKKYSK